MANKYLGREGAPFDEGIWGMIDGVMVNAAKSEMVGRRLLHLEGPYGLGLKFIPMPDKKVSDGVTASQVLPVMYLYKNFQLDVREIANFERDKIALDLSPVAEAAMWCARSEDNIIFNGTGTLPGLLNVEGSHKVDLSSWQTIGQAADDIIKAVTTLDIAGFHGPYALALAPGLYNLLLRRYPQGSTTELDHIKSVVGDGVFKAPALSKGGVLIASGSQFASLIVGQDMSIGFVGPAEEKLELSISESMAVRIRVPGSICVLEG